MKSLDKYFSKRAREEDSPIDNVTPLSIPTKVVENEPSRVYRTRIEVDLTNLPSDPSLRSRISDYDANDQDKVRLAYLQMGPCQPSMTLYPKKIMGGKDRRFVSSWFTQFGSWLEYSVSKDAAFCLPCYLFCPEFSDRNKSDAFVRGGFDNWKQKDRLQKHANSEGHNAAYMKTQNLLNHSQHIAALFDKKSKEWEDDYRLRLITTIDVIRFLLRQALSFRSHDESEDSMNKGNFLELLEWLAKRDASVNKIVLKNAPGNHKLTCPNIQKDIVNAIASEITKTILKDLGGDPFAILIDEARDVSIKEQMSIVVRYVNKRGFVMERFMGMVHVADTTAKSLKASLDQFFNKHNLSVKNLRGQGYDGASNMQGEYNGLKSLILKENKSAFYVHCFAHQLQLALVKVAKDLKNIDEFFFLVNNVVNIVGASCKRRDILREKEVERIKNQLMSGEISSGRGLNQETSVKRAGDTRWGSHYGTLINLIVMYGSVLGVLDDLGENSTDKKGEAINLMKSMQSFDFVFTLHLMKNVLAISNELSKALQRKDQDIVNAMTLVKLSKSRMQILRDSGWENLLMEASSFSVKHDIEIPNMESIFCLLGRSRRGSTTTNLHHYKVDLFYLCVDKQLVELNNRFDEVNSELLICIASFDPAHSFNAFDINKLVRLSEFYVDDFTEQERIVLRDELELYEFDIKSDSDFVDVDGMSGLARKMVETGKHVVYGLVYRLIKLSLILPVSTATVERSFSAMNIVKTDLRNRMGDGWLSDSCVTYIEKDVFDCISNDAIVDRFQKMKNRRGIL